MDSLFPFLQGLAPLQHVGLSRRTVNHRQPVPSQFSAGFPLGDDPGSADVLI